MYKVRLKLRLLLEILKFSTFFKIFETIKNKIFNTLAPPLVFNFGEFCVKLFIA